MPINTLEGWTETMSLVLEKTNILVEEGYSLKLTSQKMMITPKKDQSIKLLNTLNYKEFTVPNNNDLH